MKQITLLAAGLFAVATSITLNVNAASETQAHTKTDVVIENDSTKKTMKPHSHMEEKLGIATRNKETSVHDAKPAKPNPASDKSKHFHPRDGK